MLSGLLVAACLGSTGLEDQIKQEENRLLALGVDVRAITPEMDAGPEYVRIAHKVNLYFESSFERPRPMPKRWRPADETTLNSLERAMQKPVAKFNQWWRNRNEELTGQGQYLNLYGAVPMEGNDIDYWITKQLRGTAMLHDWSHLERIARLKRRFQDQAASCNGLFPSRDISGPLMSSFTGFYDPEVGKWFRAEIEKFDVSSGLKSFLSGFARDRRAAIADRVTKRCPDLVAKWKAKERDPLWLKKGELALLNGLYPVLQREISNPRSVLNADELQTRLTAQLKEDKTWPADWAFDQLSGKRIPSGQFSRLAWNEALINLDLEQAKFEGRTLEMTWSKKYAYDPESQTYFKVNFSNGYFQVYAESPLPNGYRHNGGP